MKPDKIDTDAEMAPYTNLDEAIGSWNPPGYRPELVTPKKCRRHDWSGQLVDYGFESDGIRRMTKVCTRCGRRFDEVAAKRGRNNRARGNAIEREVAAKLGMRRVGQFGGPDDIAGELFRVQVKSGGSFSERYWQWLRAVPATAGQTRLLVVTDAPGPGHRRRAIVVLDLDDWLELHGDVA